MEYNNTHIAEANEAASANSKSVSIILPINILSILGIIIIISLLGLLLVG